MVTNSKTLYHSSELEIEPKMKEQHNEKKKKKAAMLLQRGQEIIRKRYEEQGLMNERKHVRLAIIPKRPEC